MEKATTNIKDPKARAYFDNVTEGKKPAVKLTAEEYEQGINEFDDGMRKIIAEISPKPCHSVISPRNTLASHAVGSCRR